MRRTIKSPDRFYTRAQSTIELAIFGAVLFFVIGAIATNYMSGAFQQNVQLQAMRMAMMKSYQSSGMNNNTKGDTSRNSGSFLFYEDRLTGEPGRYGTSDRQPIAAQGQGMLTKNLMAPVDWSEDTNLGLMDVTINGQSFQFTTAAFVTYKIMYSPYNNNSYPRKLAEADGSRIHMYKWPAPNTSEFCANKQLEWANAWDPLGAGCKNNIYGICKWHTKDVHKALEQAGVTGRPPITLAGCPGDTDGCLYEVYDPDQVMHKRLVYEWEWMSRIFVPNPAGLDIQGRAAPMCRKITRNDKDFLKDLNDTVKLKYEFNYNRDGNVPLFGDFQESLKMAWRWEYADFYDMMYKTDFSQFLDPANGIFPQYDVDGDLIEETVYAYYSYGSQYDDMIGDTGGVTIPPAYRRDCRTTFPNPPDILGYQASVLDPKAGDIDLTQRPPDYWKTHPHQGLLAGMRIYTRTVCVPSAAYPCPANDPPVYFELKEGKSYALDGKTPLSISSTQRYQYDLIERIFQLNPNLTDDWALQSRNSASIPVYCAPGENCCMDQINMDKTCFDRKNFRIYIRSRISNRGGHRWITDMSRNLNQVLGGK